MLPGPGPLSAPGFSPPLLRAALDARARQTAQAAAAGTLHTKPANERSTVCGGSGLVPASEHGGCLPPKARGRESQARPSGNEGLPFLGPWSLREDGRRERSRIHRTPLAVSRSEAAPLWATSPLLSRGQPSNYGHTPRPLGARIRAVAVLAVKSTLSPDMTLEAKGSDRSHGSQPAGLAGPTLPLRPPAHAVPMAGDPAVQGHVCPLPSEAGRPPAGRGHLVCCSTGHDRSRRPL